MLRAILIRHHEFTDRNRLWNRPYQRKVDYQRSRPQLRISSASLTRQDDILGFDISAELSLSVEVVKSLRYVSEDELADFFVF